MNCPICKAETSPDQNYCLQCGTTQTPITRARRDLASPGDRHGSNLAGVAVLMLLALALSGYFYLRAGQKRPPGAQKLSAATASPLPTTTESGTPHGDPISRSSAAPSESGSGIGPGKSTTADVGDGQSTAGDNDYNRVFSSKEVSQKVRVLYKPEPGYTEAARQNQIAGTVVLRAVFTSAGTVDQITPIRELPIGLTEKAVAAAKEIKYIPAVKYGHNVSTYIQLEYIFNLY